MGNLWLDARLAVGGHVGSPFKAESPDKTGGEGGIRTLGTGYPVRQISNLVPSTTRPPLRSTNPSDDRLRSV
jgi:hypothetical protein